MADAIIMILVGLLFTAMGFRVIGPRSGANSSTDPKRARAERLYRIIGPIILLCGLGMALIRQLTGD